MRQYVILRMRKLAVAALSFSAAVFAANYILSVRLCLILAVAFLLAGAALFSMRRKWMTGLVICSLSLSVGLICFGIHYLTTTLPAHELEGRTLNISAKVLSYPKQYDDFSSAEIEIKLDGMSDLRAVLYDRNGSLAGLTPGMRISGKVKLSGADTRYGESYDYYNARDIYLVANTTDVLEALPASGFDLRCLAARVNHFLASKVDALFPSDTAHFMKSLMLGDKTELYKDEELYLAMQRSGIMHIVAVSGMHVAFLVGLLQLLLGVSPRSSVLCLVLVWSFVFVTGAQPSAVRAGIMQTLLLLAPLLKRENDDLTSLSTALALILLFNPYAAASVGLQLSFASMAGILFLSEKIRNLMIGRRRKGFWRRVLEYPVDVVASSAAAMIFSVPLMAHYFGYVSVLAPLTNVLIMWLVSFCFGGGFAACAASLLFMPLGRLIAVLVSWLERWIFFAAKFVSSLDFSVVYLEDKLFVWWLLLVYLLFILAFRARASTSFRLVLPTVLSVITLCLALNMTRLYYNSAGGFITVLDVGQGQSISVFSGESTVMIDCGSIYTLDNAGDRAIAYLKGCGRKKIDLLLLTHLHADHVNGVIRLMAAMPVETIAMPIQPNDDDGQLENILAAAEKNGTQVIYISRDTPMSIGGIDLLLYAPGRANDTNERCVMAKVSLGDYDMLVTGDGSRASEQELLEGHAIGDVELLIAGHHGSRYACGGEFLESIGADTAVISVGYNTFGHPTNETLERLEAYGYNIYRTDLNGSVEIRVS